MLTFLRKIRKSLIENGSTRKYILYAIGEIALVVFGILIALQVNNWNENRKARNAERASMISLMEEFKKNRTDLQDHIHWKEGVQKQWDIFLNTISDREIPAEQRAIRRPLASYVNYIISNSTLNSLLASGRIENLKNDSLRHMLISWEDVVSDFKQFQEMHRDFVNAELLPVESNLIPYITNRRYGFDHSFLKEDPENQLLLNAYENMTYQNILLRNFYWINIQLREIAELEIRMNEIIRMLERETKE
jgi:hypothetical protein